MKRILEKVEYPNKGLVYVGILEGDGENGIPGQKVQFVINKKRSGRAEGRLLEVLEKISAGDKRTGVQYFSILQGLYVSDHEL